MGVFLILPDKGDITSEQLAYEDSFQNEKTILQSEPSFNLQIKTGTKSKAKVSSRKVSSSAVFLEGGRTTV